MFDLAKHKLYAKYNKFYNKFYTSSTNATQVLRTSKGFGSVSFDVSKGLLEFGLESLCLAESSLFISI